MLTFVKLGGSLITDKQAEARFRDVVVTRLAGEICEALKADKQLRLLIGHGSGSYGHVAASRYRITEGVHTPEAWRGLAHVATVASELNYLVVKALHDTDIPVWRFQPSASARCRDGVLDYMAVEPIREAITHNLVPVVYGDVALDMLRGGTIISTEEIFAYLVEHLPVERILLLGEVEGVYDQRGNVIPEITPTNIRGVEQALGGSAGTDVTGGMRTKVLKMVALVERFPGLEVRIMNGARAGLLQQTLLGRAEPGTLIHAG